MIKDDVLVFDCVAHPFNFDPSNALGQPGEQFINHLYAFHNVLTPESEPKLSEEEFLKEWSTAEIARMVFDESDTDMLVAMPLPLTDLFHDGLSPWERCAELRDEYPDRTVFWGTVNPLEGRKALEQMEVQVNEYGATAFKFYNVRYDYGEPFPWRMDDPQVAFPVFEKAQELGINLIGVHKGLPLGPQPLEVTHVGHGRSGGEFPGYKFCDLPRGIAVHRRNLLAARALSEPLRLDSGHGQLRGAFATAVRGVARQAPVLVRGGQDHLRFGSSPLSPQVGFRRLLDLRAPAGPHRGLRLPAANRASQA